MVQITDPQELAQRATVLIMQSDDDNWYRVSPISETSTAPVQTLIDNAILPLHVINCDSYMTLHGYLELIYPDDKNYVWCNLRESELELLTDYVLTAID